MPWMFIIILPLIASRVCEDGLIRTGLTHDYKIVVKRSLENHFHNFPSLYEIPYLGGARSNPWKCSRVSLFPPEESENKIKCFFKRFSRGWLTSQVVEWNYGKGKKEFLSSRTTLAGSVFCSVCICLLFINC